MKDFASVITFSGGDSKNIFKDLSFQAMDFLTKKENWGEGKRIESFFLFSIPSLFIFSMILWVNFFVIIFDAV